MKISDLMHLLAETKETHGDLPIFCIIEGIAFLAEEAELSKSIIEVVDRKNQKALMIGE